MVLDTDAPAHKEIPVPAHFTHHRFHLVRDRDTSGISGTGIVAEGIAFTDGTVVVRWVTNEATPPGVSPTTVVHEGIESVLALHGHGGTTWVQWMDSESH